MIDMHTHILFGIDDGPETVEESIELISESVGKGVSHIIFTPHYNRRNRKLKQEKILENFQILKDAVAKENIEVDLYLGNEIFLGSAENPIDYEKGFYSLAGSKYILIEFSLTNPPSNIEERCYQASSKGFIPIISHVERYEMVINKDNLREILAHGTHLQVNASNILNKESKEKTLFAHYLLKEQLVSFVASDVHNNSDRGFHLDEAYNLVSEKYGGKYADKIFKYNQLNIIDNKEFDNPKLSIEI